MDGRHDETTTLKKKKMGMNVPGDKMKTGGRMMTYF